MASHAAQFHDVLRFENLSPIGEVGELPNYSPPGLASRQTLRSDPRSLTSPIASWRPNSAGRRRNYSINPPGRSLG